MIVWVRSGLRTAERTLDVAATDGELIPVLSEWLEIDSFNLDSVINVRGRVGIALVDDVLQTSIARNDILDADGMGRSCDILGSVVVVVSSSTVDRDIGGIGHEGWSNTGPENDRGRPWVTGQVRNVCGKGQTCDMYPEATP